VHLDMIKVLFIHQLML